MMAGMRRVVRWRSSETLRRDPRGVASTASEMVSMHK